MDALTLRQIIADIDQKRTDTFRKEQEMRFEPRKFVIQVVTAAAALFGAGAAFGAFVTTHLR